MTLSSELGPVSYVTVARGPGSPSTNQRPVEGLIDQSEAARGHSKVTTLSESRSPLTHIISHLRKKSEAKKIRKKNFKMINAILLG